MSGSLEAIKRSTDYILVCVRLIEASVRSTEELTDAKAAVHNLMRKA